MEDSIQGPSLKVFSNEIAALVERAAASIVRIEDGSRLTATGIVWSADGVIVTTSHGVERDEDIAVELADGSLLPATLMGRDLDTDIAVLRVQSDSLTPIARGSSDAARIGSLALAIARPGRAGLQATLGIVSARVETQSGGKSEFLLHTDAEMHPGFSGGALVGADGELLGMTNLMFGRGRGIALGTPILENIAEALVTGGRVRKGYLGIRTQQVTLPERVRERLPAPQEHALLIAQVEQGSPAEAGGLLMGDTLLALDGTAVANVDILRRLLRHHAPDSAVELQIVRGGEPVTVQVTLGSE